jgi:hypothetical protein
MGSVVGAITGSTGVGKKAKRGYEEAGQAAQYKPWDVTGSYFGSADFDYENNKANYELSPELIQLRDMFMNQALSGVNETDIAQGQAIKDKGLSMFNEAFDRDISKVGSDYYSDLQEILAPERAKSQQGLANNLFASGRMGQGSAAYEGGGYLNPERMEYLTAMNREDNQLAVESLSRARQEQMADMSSGLGYYGIGNDLRMQPYNDVYSLFGMGSGVEATGMKPFEMGMGLGSAAVPGQQAMAGLMGQGVNAQYQTGAANSGAFTNLVGTGLQAYGAGGGFGSTISAGAKVLGK